MHLQLMNDVWSMELGSQELPLEGGNVWGDTKCHGKLYFFNFINFIRNVTNISEIFEMKIVGIFKWDFEMLQKSREMTVRWRCYLRMSVLPSRWRISHPCTTHFILVRYLLSLCVIPKNRRKHVQTRQRRIKGNNSKMHKITDNLGVRKGISFYYDFTLLLYFNKISEIYEHFYK